MGLIVNKPAPELRFGDLLAQLKIEAGAELPETRVHFGGPVEHGRGFVLHTSDYGAEDSSLSVSPEFSMTATVDILRDMAKGAGPTRALLALGYAGWGPGQLEDEIGQNGWLTCDLRSEIIFGRANEHKWTAALKVLGIDPVLLSSTAGHA